MVITLLCYLPSVFGLTLIGLAILLKNPRSRINLSFFAVAIIIALWLLGICLSYLHLNYELSLWALRLGVGIGTFIAPALLLFGVYFPLQTGKMPKLLFAVVLALAAGLLICSLTPLLIPAIAFRQYSVAIKGVGSLYTVQTVYEIAAVAASFVIVLRKRSKVAAREKMQISLVVGGLVVAAAVNVITNFVLVIVHGASYFSDLAAGLSLVVFVSTTAYAIVKHRLFDMRLAITRTIGFVVTVGLVSILYSLLMLSVVMPFLAANKQALARSDGLLLLFLPPTIVVALTFHTVQRFIARITRRVFYQDSYNTRDTLDALSDALISDNNIDIIMTRGCAVLRSALKPAHSLLIVLDDKGQIYRHLADGSEPKQVSALVAQAAKHKERVYLKDDVAIGRWPAAFEVADMSLVLRLGEAKAPIGLLFLGPKQNGRIYNQQDVGLLTVSAKNFGVAIDNAKKYEQISAFADTMHQEVLRATVNLRRANAKLKALDKLKDDFISMASHQLRSPATSVHEAILMLNQGILTPKEHQEISMLAEASSERLVGVVTDMLNMARIQAGHFTVEKNPVDLVELVDRALLQASGLAKQKSITLSFTKPAEPPKLRADRAKLNEAMSNYIENAIKYSPKGTTVTVTLRQDGKSINFEVVDQGIGVPEQERKDLFGKFYRASNARLEEPNGNGIGLYVVKKIAEAHGGEAYYKPLDRGSLFGFRLPA